MRYKRRKSCLAIDSTELIKRLNNIMSDNSVECISYNRKYLGNVIFSIKNDRERKNNIKKNDKLKIKFSIDEINLAWAKAVAKNGGK